MNIRSIIFDLDGTLLETTDEIHYIFNELLSLNDLPIRSRQFYRDNIGNGIEHLLSRCLPEDFSGDHSSLLLQAKELYATNLNKRSHVFDGILNVLDQLSKKNVKIGIITNKMHHLAVRCVDLFFHDYDILTIGAEHLYPRKPKPDSALFLAKTFGHLPSEMLFVGDSSVDMQTAENAGMRSAGVLWGNGTKRDIEDIGADMTFASTSDLEAFVTMISAD